MKASPAKVAAQAAGTMRRPQAISSCTHKVEVTVEMLCAALQAMDAHAQLADLNDEIELLKLRLDIAEQEKCEAEQRVAGEQGPLRQPVLSSCGAFRVRRSNQHTHVFLPKPTYSLQRYLEFAVSGE